MNVKKTQQDYTITKHTSTTTLHGKKVDKSKNTKSEQPLKEVTHTNDSPETQMEEENLSASPVIETLEKEETKDDVTVTVITKDANSNPTLALHNFFDLLHEESDIPYGETLLVHQEQNHSSNDMLQAILKHVDLVPHENACLVPCASSEQPSELKKMFTQPAL